MEMIDPAPTLPAFLETTPPAWTENRLAWLPVFGTRLRTGFWAGQSWTRYGTIRPGQR